MLRRPLTHRITTTTEFLQPQISKRMSARYNRNVRCQGSPWVLGYTKRLMLNWRWWLIAYILLKSRSQAWSGGYIWKSYASTPMAWTPSGISSFFRGRLPGNPDWVSTHVRLTLIYMSFVNCVCCSTPVLPTRLVRVDSLQHYPKIAIADDRMIFSGSFSNFN